MAVYGRFRERWNPTKRKSKGSKNRTYVETGNSGAGKLLYWLNAESKDVNNVSGIHSNDIHNDGLLDIYGSLELGFEPIRAAHFKPNALHFPKDGTNRVYVEDLDVGFTTRALAGSGRTYDTFISFWVKVSQFNFQTSGGHHLGGFYRALTAESDGTPLADLQPAILFGLGSSGQPEMTIFSSTDITQRLFWSGPTDGKTVQEDTWTHVCFAIKKPFGVINDPVTGLIEEYEYQEMVDLYIDGTKVSATVSGTVLSNADLPPNSAQQNDIFDTAELSVLLGNQVMGFSDTNQQVDENGDPTPTEGFFGSLGEFLVFTQPPGNSDSIAKFVYEAQREGAYHLHSGIHNSSPRLEQLDLDRDSLYPSNFTLENYTMGVYQASEDRISKRSESRFTEGYNTEDSSYAWQENASQYFENKNTSVLPHLRLHYSDTLLTNGDWYSDARSEFFSEDLDEFDPDNNKYGFTIDDQASDELYREHLTDSSTKPFVEFDIPEEYKDCFVIEIPIPVVGGGITLGTDTGGGERSNIDAATSTVVANPIKQIMNMAYYNFDSQTWLHTHIPDGSGGYWDGRESGPDDTRFLSKNAIGFTPMTGIIVPSSERVAEKVVPMHGLPTSDFGFPTAKGYNPRAGETFDLSKYIDEPVILEGWEIKTRVIPNVGFDGYSKDNSQDSDFGINTNGGKSPFEYGAHGSAAVLYQPRRQYTAFHRNVVEENSKEYHVHTTIPTTAVDGDGNEVQPSIEQDSLVTSGITAFLLKRPKIVDTDALGNAMVSHVNTDKEIHKITNLDDEAGGWLNTDTIGLTTSLDSTSYGGHYDGSILTRPFIGTNDAYNESNNLQLLGWLQHVFHNDPLAETHSTRDHWVRDGDNFNSYFFREGKNLIELLNKENATYVPDLLYSNSDYFDLNVRGNTKSIGQINRGIPISNFFLEVDPVTQYGPVNNFANNDPLFAVSTSSESTFNLGDGGLSNHDVIPRFGNSDEIGASTQYPRVNFPSRFNPSSTDTVDHRVPLRDTLENDSVVILNPTDELVLGIQNSISTCFASQQIFPGEAGEFIRWGRTRLQIPQQNSDAGTSYIRLFVKKTRNDKDFNVVSDSSDYNANVNRDLGDTSNGDRWKTSNLTIYSGSIADDIVGPTYFTPPEHKIFVSRDLVGGNTNLPVLGTTSKGVILSLAQRLRDVYNTTFPGIAALFSNDWNEVPVAGGGTTGAPVDFPEDGAPYHPDDPYNELPLPATNRPDWFAVGSWAFDQARDPNAVGRGWHLLSMEEKLEYSSMDFLLRYYTEAELDTAIQNWLDNDRRLANNSLEYVLPPEHDDYDPLNKTPLMKWMYEGPTTMATLGIPAQPISFNWTQFSRQVYSYGGPFPAVIPKNLFDQVIPTESIHGFVTRYHRDLQTSGDPAILDASILHSGPWNGFTYPGPPGLDSDGDGNPDYPYDGWRPEGAWLVEELNPNPDKPALALIKEPRRRPIEECGAVSSWYCRFKIPYFEGNVLSKRVGSLSIEFRFIKIDGGNESDGTLRRPVYSDGSPMAYGDAFFFNKAHETIKIDTTFTPTKSNTQVFPIETTVYIIAGEGVPESANFLDNFDWNGDGVSSFPLKFYWMENLGLTKNMTWQVLWNTVQRVVINQKIQNPSLLYTVVPEQGELASFAGFTLQFPNDPVVTEVFGANADEINSGLEFTLCGVDLTNITRSNAASIFPEGQELYGVDVGQAIGNGWDGAPADPQGTYDYYTNNPRSLWLSTGGRLYDADGNEAPSNDGAAPVGVFYNSFVARTVSHYYYCGDRTKLGMSELDAKFDNSVFKWAITYDGIDGTPIRYESNPATYTEELGRIIDRKVLFRSSVKDTTVQETILDPNLIGKAGPFGTLKRMTTLVDTSRTYWDSIMPLVDIEPSVDLTSYTPNNYSEDGLGMGWMLDGNEAKDGNQFPTSNVSVTFDDNNPSLYDASNSNSIEYIYRGDDAYLVQFPPALTINNVLYDKLPVVNIFQRDFRGTRDFSKYTLRNLVYMIGDGARGRHVIRPSLSIWGGFNTTDIEANMFWPDELILDPPRGTRFGLLSYDEAPKYAFSSYSFGHLRDMFEQSLDTKMSNFESDPKLFGSPVVVNAINPTNPEVPKLMENTSRFNKTENATIVKPYIEDNYEGIPNPVNLQSEKLRVDVAGSIKSKQILAPGNVASNIRRR